MTTGRAGRGPLLLGWALLVLAGLGAVARVAFAATRLPATAAEPQLVDAAYAGVNSLPATPVDPALLTTGLQLRLYTMATAAFHRHTDVLTSAREMAVGATAGMVLGLALVVAILRVRPLVAALTVAVLVVSGPVLALLATVSPAVTATAWLALGAAAGAAALARHDLRWLIVGGIALLAALITLPAVAIPVALGGAGAAALTTPLGRRWRAVLAGVGLAAAVAMAVLVRRGTFGSYTALLDTGERLAVLGVVVLIAATAATVGWLRPAAVGTGLGALAAIAVGPRAEPLLPTLVVAALALLAITIDEAITAARPAPRVSAALATAFALAGIAGGVLDPPATGPRPDHTALAAWISGNVDGGVPLAAVPGVWSDLDRDLTKAGRSPGTVRRADPAAPPRDDELLSTLGAAGPPGTTVAAFGSDGTGIAVLTTGAEAQYLSSFARPDAGRELAANTRLTTTEPVRTALRDGHVDVRAMALLAGLCQNHAVTVATTTQPAAERGFALPERILIVSTVDGHAMSDPTAASPVLAWLHAQQAPYAPTTVRATRAGIVLGWRIPVRIAAFPS